MRTEELIVQLARSAGPVEPLAPAMTRMVRWTAGAVLLVSLGVVIVGTRADAATVITQSSFALIVLLTMATALLSAAAALVLSIPGAERSRIQRWLPIIAGAAWAAWLGAALIAGGAAGSRLLAMPVHVACILQITALGLLPALVLMGMIRRAAPLEAGWNAGLAALAALALGAVGTQFICPIDDPAHLLVGHFMPVALVGAAAAWLGGRRLRTSSFPARSLH